jgi:ketosteroid isomerase-like protein
MRSKNIDTAIALLDAGARDDYEAAARLVGPGLVVNDWARGVHGGSGAERQEVHDSDQAFANRQLDYLYAGETGEGAVIVQLTERATHVGPLHGVAASGKEFTTASCHIFRFDDEGRIISIDSYEDHLSIMIQLGAVDLPR